MPALNYTIVLFVATLPQRLLINRLSCKDIKTKQYHSYKRKDVPRFIETYKDV